MSQAPKHSFTADFAEFELLLDGDIEDPLLYDRIPIDPSEWRGVFDATPVKSSGSLIISMMLKLLKSIDTSNSRRKIHFSVEVSTLKSKEMFIFVYCFVYSVLI